MPARARTHLMRLRSERTTSDIRPIGGRQRVVQRFDPYAHAVVAKRQHGWALYYVMYNHSWRPSTSENNFLSRNLAEPVADAPLCCARAPAHRHVAPRRPGSELFTWRRLRCPKGSCIGKRGEGRWWVRSPANSRTSFSKRQKDYRKIGTTLFRSNPRAEAVRGGPRDSVPIIAVLELTSLYPLRPPADDLLPR